MPLLVALGDALAELIKVFGWENDDIFTQFGFDFLCLLVEGQMVDIRLWFELFWVLDEFGVFVGHHDDLGEIWIPLSKLFLDLFDFMMFAVEVVGVVVGGG